LTGLALLAYTRAVQIEDIDALAADALRAPKMTTHQSETFKPTKRPPYRSFAPSGLLA